MNIFYFIHITGTDSGISGVPRVVRNLARELALRPGITLVPVCWSVKARAIVHAEQKLLDNLSRNGGPELQESHLAGRPIEHNPEDWLLIPEVPHLQSHFADYPPILIDEPIGCAARSQLKVAVIVHDILPLTHPFAGRRKGLFSAEATEDVSLARDPQMLRFVDYAHGLALADLVIAVSQTTGDLLRTWLLAHGHREKALPPIAPVVLPEEVFGTSRVLPPRDRGAAGGPVEFLSIGTVSTHKNQLSAMSAFLRLTERRPELDLRLNVVGLVAPDLAIPASLIAKRSRGRIVLHGRLPDRQIQALMKRARATVFVSLAEGYGLPVAESLWYGKPCLCSGEGSMGEIAQGGGCLTVNPGSLDDIESGFETLATDAARYDDLLREIGARQLKTWRLYAGDIVQELASFAKKSGIDTEGIGSSSDDEDDDAEDDEDEEDEE